MSNPRQTMSYLRRRMSEVGIEPVKRHGQNFLIDLNLLELLADTADIQPWDVVLEIGTGMGSLTGIMAPRAAHVVSVEIDRRMHQLASEELIDHPNITLLNCDALAGKHEFDPAVFDAVRTALTAGPKRRFKLAANLPYCAATPILSNLLLCDPTPVSMTVTIQKELAERIVASPSTKDYSALSVWVQSQCRAEIIRELAPSVFWPRPQVDSAIIQITTDPVRRARIKHPRAFQQLTRQLFMYRRKLLRGVLATVLKGRLDKPAIDVLLHDLGHEPGVRAEELTPDQLLGLSDLVALRAPLEERE